MDRHLPNLKQLRAFEAAARHLSFKSAAGELNVSQAAISHQIKALEQYFGSKLFIRNNRKVTLTRAGEDLARDLTKSLDDIARACDNFRSQEMRGKIRISTTPFYANRMIHPFLDEFLRLHPGLEVDFHYSYSISDFSDSDVDGALRYGLSDRSEAQLRLIHYDWDVPVAAPSLVQGVELPLTAKDIAKLPLAAVEGQEHYWHQWFKAAGQKPPARNRFSLHRHRGLALDFTLAGNAVALGDLPLVRNELGNGSLVRLSDVEITLDRGVHLAQPLGAYQDARVAAFGDWLAERVARISAELRDTQSSA
jgi:LysR family glycine cleavage system transcriptional activator